MFFSFLNQRHEVISIPDQGISQVNWSGGKLFALGAQGRWRSGSRRPFEHLTSDFILWFFLSDPKKTVVYSCMKIFLYNIYIYNVYIILEYLGNKMARTDLGGFPWRMAEASGCEWWWNHRCETTLASFSFYHHGKAKSIFCVDGGWWSPEIEYLEMNAIHIQKYLENAGKTVPIYIYMYVCIYIYISNMGFVVCKRHESWGYG